jgi:hypothetical protein
VGEVGPGEVRVAKGRPAEIRIGHAHCRP